MLRPLPELWLRALRLPDGFRLPSTRFAHVTADALRARAPGEVKKPETISYRTHAAEPAGLFCEQVFGPGSVGPPDASALETDPRATTFGRHELPCPIVHPLAMAHAREDVAERAGWTLAELEASAGDPERRTHLTERLAATEAGAPLLVHAIAVLPPALRPMVPIPDSERWATSDLNDHYRRVINRANRLRRLLELNAPPIILANEERMMAEAIRALFENEDTPGPVTAPQGRALVSLRGLAGGTAGLVAALTDLDARLAMGTAGGPLPGTLHTRIAALYAMGFELHHSVLIGMGLA